MESAFIDTSGWANFFIRSQPWHGLADNLLRDIRKAGQAVTSNYVLAELAALMISPLRLQHALRQEVFDAIRRADWIEIVHVDEQLDSRSWQSMARHQDKDFSLVDCSSFVLMKDRGLSSALTADRHFEQAGFVRLLKIGGLWQGHESRRTERSSQSTSHHPREGKPEDSGSFPENATIVFHS